MKKFEIRILIIVATFCILTRELQAQTDSASRADHLIKIEQSLCDALPGDSSTWSKYLDPQWWAVTEDGTGSDKKKFLEGFSAFPNGVSGNIHVINPVCLFHENMAIVHYTADENEIVFGQKLHTSYAVMDTWYASGNSWKMISMQIFEIPQSPLARTIVSKQVKAFTGSYELTKNRTAVISLRGDSLFIQKNNHPPEILYQENDNTFFTVNNPRVRILFMKDGSGLLEMRERRNTQDLVWKMKPAG